LIQREHVTLGIAITTRLWLAVSLSWTIFRDVLTGPAVAGGLDVLPENLGGALVEFGVKGANDWQ